MNERDFQPIRWDEALRDDCRELIRLAVREDLDRAHDWTTIALAPAQSVGRAAVCSRRPGVVAGLPAAQLVFEEMNLQARLTPQVEDGQPLAAGQCIARLEGSARDLLTSERIVLNLLGRLSGVATLARQYVDRVAHTQARVYDTRKTTPGWRRLEKYAARCGGASNHRTGLYDAVLIKDNHLQFASLRDARFTVADAVRCAREFLVEQQAGDLIVEVEVDTLEQLREALPAAPDIVLLDNMDNAMLRQAVAIRDQAAPAVQLEASGGVQLETIGAIAETGVERISVGAMTHSAIALDIGLDWEAQAPSPTDSAAKTP